MPRKVLVRPGFLFLALASASLTAGCSSDYMHREDRIGASAGDSIAANKALHVVDPWRRESFNVDHATSGQRLSRPVEHYRNGPAQGTNSPSGAPVSGGATTAAASGVTTR